MALEGAALAKFDRQVARHCSPRSNLTTLFFKKKVCAWLDLAAANHAGRPRMDMAFPWS